MEQTNVVMDKQGRIYLPKQFKKDLGRKATDADLTSIDTWIKVDEAEQQITRKGPLKPD